MFNCRPKKATENNFPCCDGIYVFLTSGQDDETGEDDETGAAEGETESHLF